MWNGLEIVVTWVGNQQFIKTGSFWIDTTKNLLSTDYTEFSDPKSFNHSKQVFSPYCNLPTSQHHPLKQFQVTLDFTSWQMAQAKIPVPVADELLGVCFNCHGPFLQHSQRAYPRKPMVDAGRLPLSMPGGFVTSGFLVTSWILFQLHCATHTKITFRGGMECLHPDSQLS